MSFSDLHLIAPLLRAVAAEGYTTPTPIQQQAIPPVLDGRDLLGCAQTGTGKTAAFALPILQRLAAAPAPGAHAASIDAATPHARQPSHRDRSHGGARQAAPRTPVRVLVLTPTRELAAQIGESFSTYGRHLHLRNTVIFGGVGQAAQERALERGAEIVVATPGRLLDLASQRKIDLTTVEIFVLDEADRMLDMGFVHDVRKVIALLPTRRQTLFFSATMPPEIADLASKILVDPARVAVAPVSSTAEKVAQKVYFIDKAGKRALLERVLDDPAIARALVFTRTKHGANRVAEHLERARIGAAVIHGNKSQNARERALSSFKSGTSRVLVATDIAARGIDVDGVSHVINFDLPDVPESYVHRIGRTARAGASGIALTFCDPEELAMLAAIERLIRLRIPVDGAHPRESLPPPAPAMAAHRQYSRSEASGRGPGGGRSRGPGQGEGRGGGRSHASADRPSRAPSEGAPRAAGGGRSHAPGGDRSHAPAGPSRGAGGAPSRAPGERHAHLAGGGRPGASGGERPRAHGGGSSGAPGGRPRAPEGAPSGARRGAHGGAADWSSR